MSDENAKVVGHNTDSDGETVGVWGEVDSEDGYGLATDDDVKVAGRIDTILTDLIVEAGTTNSGDAQNVIMGHASNGIGEDVVGATIAGGGFDNGSQANPNEVTGDYGSIGGGENNTASGSTATVGGGDSNTASGDDSTVGGGRFNDAGTLATVGGGAGNDATESSSTIAGGLQNDATDSWAAIGGGQHNDAAAPNATIGGGRWNTADADSATVGGGDGNTVSGTEATVAGGNSNEASGTNATIGGGAYNDGLAAYATIGGGGPSDLDNPDTTNNVIYDQYGTIGGGGNNQAGVDDGNPESAEFATVCGGKSNEASGERATVGGGDSNEASGFGATVGGGNSNEASDFRATVGGGWNNTASDADTTVSGGQANEATSTNATVGGGFGNVASSFGATIPGGHQNVASGSYSFAVGHMAKANNEGAIVFGDSTSDEVTSGSDDEARFQMEIVAEDGVTEVSARAAKTNINPVDPQAVLDGVQSLDVASWEYKDADGNGKGRQHIGPMAGDFHDAFDVGGTSDTINSIDRGGVALAAIQGLSEQLADARDELDEKDDQIAALESEKDNLREANDELRERLSAIETHVGMDASQRGVADN